MPSEVIEDSEVSSHGKWSQHLDIGFYLAPAVNILPRQSKLNKMKTKRQKKEYIEDPTDMNLLLAEQRDKEELQNIMEKLNKGDKVTGREIKKFRAE